MFAAADDDDVHGNHTLELYSVNLLRGSWRFPTLVTYFRRRRRALQQFADVLAKVGVIEPVKLPEFEPFERIKALWKHNAVHPVEAVARDLGLPGRYEDGLKKARTEVMLQALNRGRKQAVADDVAGTERERLFPERCSTCKVEVKTSRVCAPCRRDAQRIDRYSKQRRSLRKAEEPLKTLRTRIPGQPI